MRISLLYVVFVFLLVTSATAQVELRYRWQPGDAYVLDKTLDLAGTIRMGTAPILPCRQHATIRKRVVVKTLDDAGRAKLNIAVLSISATKSVGEEQFKYSWSPEQIVIEDSLVWSGGEPGKAAWLSHRMKQLFRPRLVWCTPRGQIEELTAGLPDFQEGILSDTGSLPSLGEEGWLVFPEKPVAVKESWEDALALPVGASTSEVAVNAQMTLSELQASGDDTIAAIVFDRQRLGRNLSLEFAHPGVDSVTPERAEMMENHQHFTGTVTFHVKRGQVLRCQAQGQAFMRYSFEESKVFGIPRPTVEYNWRQIWTQTEWKRTKGD